MSDVARFQMKDEGFVCKVCGRKVEMLGYTARDHCPYCLSSIHIDIHPGDRRCTCLGILQAMQIESSKKGGYKIIYRCQKCGQIKKNVVARDDDFDVILDVMSHPTAL